MLNMVEQVSGGKEMTSTFGGLTINTEVERSWCECEELDKSMAKK